MRRKILIEDCPPRRKQNFYLGLGAVALMVAAWLFMAIGWIALKIPIPFLP